MEEAEGRDGEGLFTEEFSHPEGGPGEPLINITPKLKTREKANTVGVSQTNLFATTTQAPPQDLPNLGTRAAGTTSQGPTMVPTTAHPVLTPM